MAVNRCVLRPPQPAPPQPAAERAECPGRVLWSIAHQSQWVGPYDRMHFSAGALQAAALLYNQTNNIHAVVPVFTKAHAPPPPLSY